MQPLIRTALVAALVSSAACTVKQTEVPGLTGPSEFALSLQVQASPDSLLQDGASQSSIVVTARDVNGRAVAGLTLRLDIVATVLANPGTLSSRTIVTGADGRATSIYTAPPPPPLSSTTPQFCSPAIFSPTLPGSCVEIAATPISTNFATVTGQSVSIHLVPPGVILPPASTPTPSFFVSPSPVTSGVAALFDASASCGGPVNGGTCTSSSVITSYDWSFGDGSAPQSGRVTSHAFSSTGTFSVTLTVTNDRGVAASTTQAVTVGASAPPTAAFTYSPTPLRAGVAFTVNASGSTATPGRTLVSYTWTWGDNPANVDTGVTETHTYAAAGTYVITLVVVDDAGRSATSTQTVTVLP